MRYSLAVILCAVAEHAARCAAEFLGLTTNDNPGVAFGLLGGYPLLAAAVSGAAFAILLLLVFFKKGLKSKTRLALSVMAGGAAANLMSRIIYGAVTDWIPLPFSGAFFHGGLFFNLADVEIALGAAAALLLYP